MTSKNRYVNWPNVIAWVKSPMSFGLSWNFDYYTYSQLPDSSLEKYQYHHKGNYKILTKEIVSLDVRKFEAFKVNSHEKRIV